MLSDDRDPVAELVFIFFSLSLELFSSTCLFSFLCFVLPFHKKSINFPGSCHLVWPTSHSGDFAPLRTVSNSVPPLQEGAFCLVILAGNPSSCQGSNDEQDPQTRGTFA
jgi:hypothetical protein